MNEVTTKCTSTGGKVKPVVNFNSCGGKMDCIEVCPYNVFELKPLTEEDAAKLNLKGKLKNIFFKNKAYVVHPESCHACGLCVKACPEKAIKLVRMSE